VKHILDCPESNIPVLSKSKATFFTDRIKEICPLMFPTGTRDIQGEMIKDTKLAENEFE